MTVDPLAYVVPDPRRGLANDQTRAATIEVYDLTELGNARRHVDRYGHNLRFAEGRGWMVWDGRRWRPGAKGSVIRKAKDIARRLKTEAAEIADPNAAEALFRWALRSQGAYVISKTVELAWSEPEIELALEDLDADPMAAQRPQRHVGSSHR